MAISRHLNGRQLAAINRIGDQLITPGGTLPGFSAIGCVSEVDRILDFMPVGDLADLKTLLTVLSFLPGFCVGWFLRLLERTQEKDGSLFDLLRLIRIGLRGLVMTLYFGHPRVTEAVGYRVSVYTEDLK